MMQHYPIETLIDYVNGELPVDEDASVYLHLSECTTCRAEYEAERTMRASLIAFGERSERELPPSLVDAIRVSTRPQRPSVAVLLERVLHPRVAVPALGGVFSLALGFVFLTSGGAHIGTNAPTSIEAAAFIERHSDAAMAMPFADRVNAPTFETAGDDTVGEGSTI